MRKLLPAAALALSLTGCVTLEVIEKGETTGPDGSYTVTLPMKWVRLTSASDRLVVTHDGFGLQRIVIRRVPADRAFLKLKKTADEKLLPSELAELQIAEIKSGDEKLSNLTVIENSPAPVGGKTGFRLHLQHRTETGLLFEHLIYGVVQKGHYYLISYHAPALHYFKKYQPDFDRTVSSFRLT